MTVEQILQVLRERDAVLYVQDGRLKYKGPRRAPDDPIRVAIQEHRAELIELFTVRPAVPAPVAEILDRESSPDACEFCPAPLAEGDPIACVACREQLSVTATPPLGEANRNAPPAMSPADLLAIAELRAWEALPLKPGELAGGSEQAWRTFTDWVRGETLRRASEAVWTLWRPTAEQYAQNAAPVAPESLEAA